MSKERRTNSKVEQERAQKMVEDFAFPRIHHLFPESGRDVDDVLSAQTERLRFLENFNSGVGVLTEKVDGQNIGISFGLEGELVLRHRGGICSPEDRIYTTAFMWARSRQHELEPLLGTDAILFIEWLEFNRGHVVYDDLPSYAIAISLFDTRAGTEGRFLSHRYMSELLESTGVPVTPSLPIFGKVKTFQDALNHVGQSGYSTRSRMEGLVFRVDDGEYNEAMMKLVHPDFSASVDAARHWLKSPLQRNSINYVKQAALLDL